MLDPQVFNLRVFTKRASNCLVLGFFLGLVVAVGQLRAHVEVGKHNVVAVVVKIEATTVLLVSSKVNVAVPHTGTNNFNALPIYPQLAVKVILAGGDVNSFGFSLFSIL